MAQNPYTLSGQSTANDINKALSETAGFSQAEKFKWFYDQFDYNGGMDYKNKEPYNNSQARVGRMSLRYPPYEKP